MSGTMIAMSGGVDSSVAAWLMRRSDCAGAMMRLFTGGEGGPSGDTRDAREVAARLGIPFYEFDFAEAFAQQVLDRFAAAYQSGATPNPCVECNRHLKFGRFMQAAAALGYDAVATGHYARIECDGGRYLLKKALDAAKDQSYVLYALTQEQLSRTRLPLGALHKAQVRDIACAQGFANAQKRESQDICFVPDGDYAAFIERHTGVRAPKGRFVDESGRELGEHRGLVHYTIGQRRGLGLSMSEPVYVCVLCARRNTVVVGTADRLFSKTLTAAEVNLIAADRLTGPVRVRARIRYRQAEQPATVWQTGADTIRVEFDTPQRAITRGQAVVLYDGDTVVGGGTIE